MNCGRAGPPLLRLPHETAPVVCACEREREFEEVCDDCGVRIACFGCARAEFFTHPPRFPRRAVEPSLLEGLDRDLGKYFYYTLSSVLHIPAVCSGQTRHDISDPLYHSPSFFSVPAPGASRQINRFGHGRACVRDHGARTFLVVDSDPLGGNFD